MSTRVTNRNLVDSYLYNMQMNLRSMMKYQNQLATGKEITKPSDDPYKAVKAIGLEGVLAKNVQYEKNIADAQGWMDTTDTAVQEILSVLTAFKGKIAQAGTGGEEGVLTSASAPLTAIAADMEQYMQRVEQVGNSTFKGKYVFGGFITDEPPFTITADNRLTSTAVDADDAAGKIVREIAPSVEFPINVSAARILNGEDGDDLGLTMQKVYNTVYPSDPMKTPNFIYEDDGPPPVLSGHGLATTASLQEQLECGMKEIERHFDNMTAVMTEVGAKQNRLESALDRSKALTISTTELLSTTEDIDYVEKITQYMSRSNVYDAALASGGKLLQMSLISYLK